MIELVALRSASTSRLVRETVRSRAHTERSERAVSGRWKPSQTVLSEPPGRTHASSESVVMRYARFTPSWSLFVSCVRRWSACVVAVVVVVAGDVRACVRSFVRAAKSKSISCAR